ncbi:MAG: beta strand repeat-containing protein [Reyranellaceae bacterium]
MDRTLVRKVRNLALAGASAAAMIVAFGGSASAQTIDYDLDLTAPLVAPPAPGPYNPSSSVLGYLESINSNQLETGAITAIIAPPGDLIMGGSFPGDLFSASVTGNSYSSTATGNLVTSSIALPLLGTDGVNDGLGILNGQVIANTFAQATVSGTLVVLELTDYASGAATLSNNSVLASTAGNNSNAVITGDLPTDYASTLSGSVVGSFNAGVLDLATAATVNITNAQVNFNAGYLAGSQAVVTGHTVEFDHDATGPLTTTAAMTVSGNTADAEYTGNATSNIFLATNGAGLQYQGSVAVVNSQANIETGGAGPVLPASSLVIGTSIVATIGDPAGDLTSLASVFNMTGNELNATTAGNSAVGVTASGGVAVGNAIAFAPGIDIIGGDTSTLNTLSIPSSNVINTTVSADLLLLSAQGNQTTFLSAGVFGGAITAYAETIVDGGGVNLSGNRVTASVVGNDAINLIEAGQTTVIDAVVAVGNLQSNDNTSMTAQNVGAAVTVTAGAAGEVLTGNVTINNNAILASATGSRSGNASLPTITLNAAELNSATGLASVSADFNGPALPEYGTLATVGGITASNLQINYGEGSSITSNVQGGAIAAILLAGAPSVNDGVVSLNNNRLVSTAEGNVAFTDVNLTGAVGAFSSAVSSAQYNVVDIGATLTDNQVTVYVDDLLAGTVVTQSQNRFSASATANSATNSLDVAGFTDLTLGGGALGTPSVTMPVLLSHDSSATGALVVLNNQSNVGGVTATASNTALPFVSVSAGDVNDGASVTISDNSVASSAIVNSANNTLTIQTANLNSANGTADQLATLSNRQTSPAGGATATTEVVGGLGAIGLVAGGDLVDSDGVTVSGNDLSASAAGNVGTNTLRYIGTSYQSDAPPIPMGGSNILTVGNQFDVDAEFVLHSNQSSAPIGFPAAQGGAYTATVSGGAMGVALTGTLAGDLVSGTVISVVDNDTLADARANLVTNNLSLTGFSALSTSTALQSSQGNGSAVSATVIDAQVGVEADDYTLINSVVTVTGNNATAQALGNTGFNTSLIGAEVLSGNSGLLASQGATKDSLATAQSSVTGDYTLTSFQSNFNGTTASASGSYQIDFNDFGGGGDMSSGVGTISSNSILALAQSNLVSNRLELDATAASGLSAALLSEQRTGDGFASTVSATATGTGFVTAGLAATSIGDEGSFPITVHKNTVTASAGDNDASNTLSASATSVLVGKGTAVDPNATIDPVNGSQAIADFALFNTQSSLGATVTATAVPGAIAVFSAGDVTGSPISVTENAVSAYATINNASNTLSLNGGTALAASGALLNSQTNGNGTGSTSATALVQGGVTGVVTPGIASGSPLNVSNNSYLASASGNQASNVLNATSTAAYGGAAVAAGGVSSGGVLSATATYSVLNSQSNVAPISATTQFVAIGAAAGTLSGGSHLTVQSNSVMSSATGNRASNSIGLSAVAGTLPSASLTSSQVNTASVTASVNGVAIGGLTGLVGGSNAAVTNNSISASAVGNSAVNRIGVSVGN